MASTKRDIDANENSFIPIPTPKHNNESVNGRLEAATSLPKVHLTAKSHLISHAHQAGSRRQDSLLAALSDRGSVTHTVPASKKTTLPQPGALLFGRSVPKTVNKRYTSGGSTLRLPCTSSENQGVPSRNLTGSSIASVKPKGGATWDERSNNHLVLRGLPDKHARIPSHESSDGKRLQASGISQRNASQRSIRTTSSLSMPREDASGKSGELLERQGRIQRELLQLHVLHSRSSEIHSQWRQSAKAHFYKRFQELVDRHTEIADIIFQTQELKNRAALVDWCRRGQAFDISKRVRILSVCIRELCENLDPSGKYNQIMGSFAAWYNREREIQESRKRGSIDDLVNPEYVEEIGAGWQNDVNALQRRLSTLTGELRMLGSANANSTLGQLLVVLQDLVIDMLTELDCIRSIECELVMQEKVWIEEQIMTLSLKVKDVGSSRDTPSKLRGLDD